MRSGAHAVARAAARFYAPLAALFAATLLLTRTPGTGIGFVAGLAFAFALIVHMLVLGAAASRAAVPTSAARAVLVLGVVVALIGVGAPGLSFAFQLTEAGAFAVTAAGSALILAVLVGRAPTMRDEEQQ